VVTLLPLVITALLLPKILGGRAKIQEPMAGTVHVTGTSDRARNAVYQSATITGVLSGDGLEARPVTVRTIVATDKLPHPGTDVPVVYCRRDPTQVKFLWDQVLSGSERAELLALQKADEMNRRSGR
jgi:hypothetical protein